MAGPAVIGHHQSAVRQERSECAEIQLVDHGRRGHRGCGGISFTGTWTQNDAKTAFGKIPPQASEFTPALDVAAMAPLGDGAEHDVVATYAGGRERRARACPGCFADAQLRHRRCFVFALEIFLDQVIVIVDRMHVAGPLGGHLDRTPQEQASTVGRVTRWLQTDDPGLKRRRKGIGQQEHIARPLVRPSQAPQLAQAFPALRRQAERRPAPGFEEFRDPAPPDERRGKSRALQQLDGG